MGDALPERRMRQPSLNLDQARQDRGYYEVEVSINGEADLHQHYNSCIKNPGHLHFIPVKNFGMNHLPENYRDKDILNMIKAFSELTVRILVRHVSAERPDSWPESNQPYPFHNCRNSDMLRTGSGWVQWVIRAKDTRCKCTECRITDRPHREWGFIVVNTATHVVFDSSEGEHTTMELFYDSDQERGAICSLTEARGKFNVREDRCLIGFATHDKKLLDRVESLCNHRNRLQAWVRIKYKDTNLLQVLHHCDTPLRLVRLGVHLWRKYHNNPQDQQLAVDNDSAPEAGHKLTIIVSHPHGCSKQITIGEWKHREEFAGDCATHTRYTYTTSTCPGSSGALVYILGDQAFPAQYYNNHAHSGCCLEEGLNMCGGGFDD